MNAYSQVKLNPSILMTTRSYIFLSETSTFVDRYNNLTKSLNQILGQSKDCTADFDTSYINCGLSPIKKITVSADFQDDYGDSDIAENFEEKVSKLSLRFMLFPMQNKKNNRHRSQDLIIFRDFKNLKKVFFEVLEFKEVAPIFNKYFIRYQFEPNETTEHFLDYKFVYSDKEERFSTYFGDTSHDFGHNGFLTKITFPRIKDANPEYIKGCSLDESQKNIECYFVMDIFSIQNDPEASFFNTFNIGFQKDLFYHFLYVI
jgi:hypothetical protein